MSVPPVADVIDPSDPSDPSQSGLGASAQEVLAGLQQRFGLSDTPRMIGHLRVLRRVGAGAMGVVYLAHDDKLEREVAVKLLRPSRRGGEQDGRLLYEARALARLQHPHVVTIHEVDLYEGAVYLAMEYAPGGDLASWLASQTRGAAEILRLFRQAGRGLAAAHEHRLVHRDFKPANVLLDADGNAKVGDFGLARSQDDSQSTQGSHAQTGVVMGTPAYMAPEVADGLPGDARSDQFSFCVALYEALAGRHPFVGQNLSAILAAVADGEIQPPKRGRKLPRRLQRTLRRGLDADPGRRHPDMRSLVHALEHRTVRPYVVTVAATAVVGAAVAYAVRSPAPDPCGQGPARVAEVWNDAARAAIVRAFDEAAQPYGVVLRDSVLTALDDYGEGWARSYRHACEATRVRGEQSEEVLDLRMECLARRTAEVASAVRLLSQATPEQIPRALDLATGLTPVMGCDDIAQLRAPDKLPEDPQRRQAVQQLREELAHVRVLLMAGETYAAQQALDALRDATARAAYRPLQAEFGLVAAQILTERGKLVEAEEALRQALAGALASGADSVAARAATTGVHLTAVRQRNPEQGRQWQWLAAPLAEHVRGNPLLQGSALANASNLLLVEGKPQAALEERARALTLLRQALGDRHPVIGEQLINQAASYRRLGRSEEAVEVLQQAQSLLEAAYGASHPKLGPLHNNLGTAYLTLDKLDLAQNHYARSLEIKRATMPPGHPSLGHAYNNLGEVYLARGQPEDALASLERARAIWREALGAEHPLLAEALEVEARALSELGRSQDAVEALRKALSILQGRDGAKAAAFAWQLAQLLDAELGNRDAAIRRAQFARTAFDEAGQPERVAEVDRWLSARGPSARGPHGGGQRPD